jgi:hypothetical protein
LLRVQQWRRWQFGQISRALIFPTLTHKSTGSKPAFRASSADGNMRSYALWGLTAK